MLLKTLTQKSVTAIKTLLFRCRMLIKTPLHTMYGVAKRKCGPHSDSDRFGTVLGHVQQSLELEISTPNSPFSPPFGHMTGGLREFPLPSQMSSNYSLLSYLARCWDKKKWFSLMSGKRDVLELLEKTFFCCKQCCYSNKHYPSKKALRRLTLYLFF